MNSNYMQFDANCANQGLEEFQSRISHQLKSGQGDAQAAGRWAWRTALAASDWKRGREAHSEKR